MNTSVEFSYEEYKEKVLSNQIENIKKEILKFNPRVKNFKVYSESTKHYNTILVYGTGHNSVFSHIYRMVVITSDFENGDVIYSDGNAICGESYTLEDVKSKLKIRIGLLTKEFLNV